MKKTLIVFAFVSVGFVLIQSCGTTKEVVENNPSSVCKSDINVTYAQIQPIIEAKCTRCHNASKKNSIGDFTSFQGLKPYLENGQFEKLVLIKKTMPKGGDDLSVEELEKIECWKANGYKN
ncbi:MAG: cytochrome c [Crocinitomicaceae bacterium]